MDHKEYSSIVLELSDSLYYICDIETNEMYYMNKRGMDLCGFSSHDDYLGQKCYKIIHGYDAPCDFCNISLNFVPLFFSQPVVP